MRSTPIALTAGWRRRKSVRSTWSLGSWRRLIRCNLLLSSSYSVFFLSCFFKTKQLHIKAQLHNNLLLFQIASNRSDLHNRHHHHHKGLQNTPHENHPVVAVVLISHFFLFRLSFKFNENNSHSDTSAPASSPSRLWPASWLSYPPRWYLPLSQVSSCSLAGCHAPQRSRTADGENNTHWTTRGLPYSQNSSGSLRDSSSQILYIPLS